MANLGKNFLGDVYFGNPDKPLPDWRKEHMPESDDDVLTDEERRALIGMLGFDPSEEIAEED
jgi:hypothetical protein